MKNKTLPRSLKISIAVIICLTISVFSLLGRSIHKMSEKTIEGIGTEFKKFGFEEVDGNMETFSENINLHYMCGGYKG